MMVQLTRLFEPGKIGMLEVKNRILMSPVGSLTCDAEGYVTDTAINYYEARAKGGVGLIILGSTFPIREAGVPPPAWQLYDDKFIPRMKELVHVIHQAGSKAVIQLCHFGRVMAETRNMFPRPDEIDVIGPSPVPWVVNNVVPREMSKDDIRFFVEHFVEGFRRAKQAGFDGVEIHGAHGYLIHSFLSPLTNKRTDEYGGSPENRARLACEILEAGRKKVGPNFVLLIRISATELLEGGIELNDVMRQAPLYARAGANAIHVSSGGEEYTVWQHPTYLQADGVMVHLAEAVKKVVNVAVITVGKIGDPILAERILEEGKADFVAMGRPLLADPELPNKAKEGRLGDINRCIFCNNCFLSLFLGGYGGLGGYGCTVNPALFREREYVLKPTTLPKKVMVIGGGLAGMQAARDLAQRGHQVFLYEKSDKLGGQWNIACLQEGKASSFVYFTEYLRQGLEKARVNIILSKEVTPVLVKEMRPDAVVMATGAFPATLDVPGAEGKNVVQAVDVITGKARVGERVVVIGGRYVGMEVALSLAQQGKRVSLVTRRHLGRDVQKAIYLCLRDSLIEQGVQIYVNSPVYEIRENGVYVAHQAMLLFLKADTIVMAVGSKPENRLAEELKGIVSEIHMIGDCVEPRNALDATREAAQIARQL